MPVYDAPVTTGRARAIYQQTAGVLRDRIATGEWPVGTRMPGKRDLARECGVAVGTLGRALDILRAEGMVETLQGSGTYVTGTEPVPRLTLEERLTAVEQWQRDHERDHQGS